MIKEVLNPWGLWRRTQRESEVWEEVSVVTVEVDAR